MPQDLLRTLSPFLPPGPSSGTGVRTPGTGSLLGEDYNCEVGLYQSEVGDEGLPVLPAGSRTDPVSRPSRTVAVVRGRTGGEP